MCQRYLASRLPHDLDVLTTTAHLIGEIVQLRERDAKEVNERVQRELQAVRDSGLSRRQKDEKIEELTAILGRNDSHLERIAAWVPIRDAVREHLREVRTILHGETAQSERAAAAKKAKEKDKEAILRLERELAELALDEKERREATEGSSTPQAPQPKARKPQEDMDSVFDREMAVIIPPSRSSIELSEKEKTTCLQRISAEVRHKRTKCLVLRHGALSAPLSAPSVDDANLIDQLTEVEKFDPVYKVSQNLDNVEHTAWDQSEEFNEQLNLLLTDAACYDGPKRNPNFLKEVVGKMLRFDHKLLARWNKVTNLSVAVCGDGLKDGFDFLAADKTVVECMTTKPPQEATDEIERTLSTWETYARNKHRACASTLSVDHATTVLFRADVLRRSTGAVWTNERQKVEMEARAAVLGEALAKDIECNADDRVSVMDELMYLPTFQSRKWLNVQTYLRYLYSVLDESTFQRWLLNSCWMNHLVLGLPQTTKKEIAKYGVVYGVTLEMDCRILEILFDDNPDKSRIDYELEKLEEMVLEYLTEAEKHDFDALDPPYSVDDKTYMECYRNLMHLIDNVTDYHNVRNMRNVIFVYYYITGRTFPRGEYKGTAARYASDGWLEWLNMTRRSATEQQVREAKAEATRKAKPKAPAASSSASAASAEACASCRKTENLLPCSVCKTFFYCNIKCQTAHWKTHKPECKAIHDREECQVKFTQMNDTSKIHQTFNAQFRKRQKIMGTVASSWSNAIQRSSDAGRDEKRAIFSMNDEVDALFEALGDKPSKPEIEAFQTQAGSILHSLNERFPLTLNSNPGISKEEASIVTDRLIELVIRASLRKLVRTEIEEQTILLAKLLQFSNRRREP